MVVFKGLNVLSSESSDKVNFVEEPQLKIIFF